MIDLNPVNNFSYLTGKNLGDTVWSLINGEGKIKSITRNHENNRTLRSIVVAFENFTLEYLPDGRISDIDKNPDLFRTMPQVMAPRPKESQTFERFIVWYLDTEFFTVKSGFYETEEEVKKWIDTAIKEQEQPYEILDIQQVKRTLLV